MNRHKKLAIIVAPFLFICGYIVTDYYSEAQKDKVEQQAKIKQLTLVSACNLQSTACVLKNDSLSLTLTLKNNALQPQLWVQSDKPLKGIKIALNSVKPFSLSMDTSTDWHIDTDSNLKKPYDIKLAASHEDMIYYAEMHID